MGPSGLLPSHILQTLGAKAANERAEGWRHLPHWWVLGLMFVAPSVLEASEKHRSLVGLVTERPRTEQRGVLRTPQL